MFNRCLINEELEKSGRGYLIRNSKFSDALMW